MQGSELEIIEVWDDIIVVEVSDVVIEVAVAEDVIEVVVGEGTLATAWGSIMGYLEDQRDLQAALDEKADADDLGALALKDDADWNDDIVNKPSSFPPSAHDHDDRYYTETEVDTALNLKAPKASPTFTGTPKAPTAGASTNNTQIATTAFVQRGLAGKSDTGHTHDDRYYTEAETDALLSGKSDTGHTHDDRYYTETETDALLGGKQDTLTFDSAPTADSTNPVTSGGIKTALDAKAALASPVFTGNPQATTQAKGNNSKRLATTAFVQTAIGDKQDVLTFDNVPTAGSTNPVTSGGVKTALDEKAAVIVCDASGDPAAFSDGAPAPVVDLTAGIVPVQDLHGYDRPWPGGAGKNLWNPEWYAEDLYVQGTRINTSGSGNVCFYAFLTEGATYTVSKQIATNRLRYGFTENIPVLDEPVTGFVQVDGQMSDTFTVPAGYPCFCCYVGTAEQTVGSIQIEAGSSATSYEPYANICPISGWTGCGLSVNGSGVSVSLPSAAGTVYGGSLDVTAGILTVTHGEIASYDGELLPGEWISDRDVYAAGTVPTAGAQVVYVLGSPVTYGLDGTEISTVLGSNTISADTGPVTLRYRADTKLYIDGKFAELQALILEN